MRSQVELKSSLQVWTARRPDIMGATSEAGTRFWRVKSSPSRLDRSATATHKTQESVSTLRGLLTPPDLQTAHTLVTYSC